MILLIPIPFRLKDGGTIEWKSLTYKISKVHKLNKVNENNLLAMGIENGNELYSIGLTKFKNIEFQKGQKILIYFSGDVMESYPAELADIGNIEIVEEKSNIDIPDDILRYCYSFRDNIQVTINELTNRGITLTITDTNELPYKYAHRYKINKEVKNENYTGVGEKIGEDTVDSTSGYTRNRTRIYMERSK